MPAPLIESELFGRERGAFTGAHATQAGRFELANRGTLFLDEIGELPLELQPKLLRVLQNGQLERLGSPRTIDVDVRIIAATNRDLHEEIRQSRFRRDLFYRLNVFPLTVPSLRDRREDIPLLVQHLVERHSRTLRKPIDTVPPAVMQAFEAYDWPGNIRELENVVQRAIILSRGGTLDLKDAWLPRGSEAVDYRLHGTGRRRAPAHRAGTRVVPLAHRGPGRGRAGAGDEGEHASQPDAEARHRTAAVAAPARSGRSG